MKRIIFATLLLLSVSCVVSKADVNAGISLSDNGNSFFLSIGDYYSVPQKEVIVVRERNIPDEEIPVVFYLAQQAKVPPATIMDLRLKGTSWQDITFRYGFGPEIYYVPVKEYVVVGPPYGHAYGYYKNKPRKEWHKIKLRDDDIVNLVNLKFISGHYNYPAETIMKMREKNKGFYNISHDIEEQRDKNKKYAKASPDNKTEFRNKADNKSRNKGKDKSTTSRGNNKSDSKGHDKSGNKGNNKGGNKGK